MKQHNPIIICVIICLYFIGGCGLLQSPPPPKIAGHDCIDLDKITTISATWVEDDQLEIKKIQLLYNPFDEFNSPNSIEVYIPIDGEIQSIVPGDATHPLQNVSLTVLAKNEPTITVELHNIDLNSDEWGIGATVKAGMHIGYADHQNPFSIGVLQMKDESITSHIFLHLTADYVFEHYQQRGFETRDIFERADKQFMPEQKLNAILNLKLN